MARLPKQTDLSLMKLKIGLNDVYKTLAFLNARVLLIFRRERHSVGAGDSFELQQQNVKLLLGKILVNGGKLRMSGQLCCGVLKLEPGLTRLISCISGLMLSVQGIGKGLARFGFSALVKNRQDDIYCESKCVWLVLDARVVERLIIVICAETAVLGAEGYLRAKDVPGITEGLLLFGTGICECRLNGGRIDCGQRGGHG